MTGLTFIAAPAYMGGGPPEWASNLVKAVAILGPVVGLAWRTRIYRSNPEPDPHIWRYRD